MNGSIVKNRFRFLLFSTPPLVNSLKFENNQDGVVRVGGVNRSNREKKGYYGWSSSRNSKKGLDRICVSVFVVPNMTYRESQSAALVFDLTLCQISWRLSTTLLESGKNVLMALVLDQDLQDNCCF